MCCRRRCGRPACTRSPARCCSCRAVQRHLEAPEGAHSSGGGGHVVQPHDCSIGIQRRSSGHGQQLPGAAAADDDGRGGCNGGGGNRRQRRGRPAVDGTSSSSWRKWQRQWLQVERPGRGLPAAEGGGGRRQQRRRGGSSSGGKTRGGGQEGFGHWQGRAGGGARRPAQQAREPAGRPRLRLRLAEDRPGAACTLDLAAGAESGGQQIDRNVAIACVADVVDASARGRTSRRTL